MRRKYEYDLEAVQEVDIPAPEKRIEFLKKCTMEGGIVPQGFPVYRGDTRAWEVVRDLGGFIPSFELAGGETLTEHARRRAERIMQVSAPDFVHYWKYPKKCREKDCAKDFRPLVFGKGGRMAGISTGCGTQGSQKSGWDYEILLPKLYALEVSSGGIGGRVGLYGDKPSLEASKFIWLHLIIGGDGSEMVSLSAVPVDRIRLMS